MNELQEAPASVTYNITSPDGFNALFTIREMNGTELMKKMEIIEKTLKEKGYKPQVKGFQKKEVEYVEGGVCPLCKGRLVKKVTKTGKPYNKCENGKWNPATQQPEGCKFVDWLDPKPMFDHQKPYNGDTIPVEEYEKGY